MIHNDNIPHITLYDICVYDIQCMYDMMYVYVHIYIAIATHLMRLVLVRSCVFVDGIRCNKNSACGTLVDPKAKEEASYKLCRVKRVMRGATVGDTCVEKSRENFQQGILDKLGKQVFFHVNNIGSS